MTYLTIVKTNTEYLVVGLEGKLVAEPLVRGNTTELLGKKIADYAILNENDLASAWIARAWTARAIGGTLEGNWPISYELTDVLRDAGYQEVTHAQIKEIEEGTVLGVQEMTQALGESILRALNQ